MQTSRWLRPEYVFHYVMWAFFILSLVADVYPDYSDNPARFFIYVFSKTGVIVVLVYLNLWLPYRLLFKRKKYLLYTLAAIVLCVATGATNAALEIYRNPDHDSTVTGMFLGQLTMAMRYLLIAFFLQITVDYYRQKETIKKIEVEKANAELNFLKAQVNPHFLFNTLNNLYALVLEKSDKSAEAVLKLADIMKYILSEGKEEKVSLEKEIQLISNYTELERLRKSDAAIRFDVTGHVNGQQMTPLLLLPLIENAFKYGLNTVAKNGFINIGLHAEDKRIQFCVENNNPPASNKEAMHSLGIGINNVKKRLDLLYHDQYEMNIHEDADRYKVLLDLNLK